MTVIPGGVFIAVTMMSKAAGHALVGTPCTWYSRFEAVLMDGRDNASRRRGPAMTGLWVCSSLVGPHTISSSSYYRITSRRIVAFDHVKLHPKENVMRAWLPGLIALFLIGSAAVAQAPKGVG